MRKYLGLLFALVLSCSLVTQVIPTALASSELLPEVEFQVGAFVARLARRKVRS